MNIIVKMHDRVRVIETTRMDLHSGIMLEDDFLDISDYLNQGVLLERSVFITTSDDMQLLKRAVTIIEPDMESFRALVVPAMEGSLPGVSEGVYERMAAALETIRK